MKLVNLLFSIAFLVLTAFSAISQEVVPEFTVQVGSFVNPKPADFAGLKSLGFVYAAQRPTNYTDVFVGGYGTEAEATKVSESLRSQGYENAFVSHLNVEGGKSVSIIQLVTKRSGDKIDWETYSQAGQLYVLLNGNQVKIVAGIFPDVPTAKAKLAKLQQAGLFKDAFVRNINNTLIHEVTDFETGGAAKKPLIPLDFSEKAPEAAQKTPPVADSPKKETPPVSYDEVTIIAPSKEDKKTAAPKDGLVSKGLPATKEAAPQEKEAAKSKEAAKPSTAPAKADQSKEPATSFTADLPEIRANVKRTSALELQKVLKVEGSYKGSLDGYYGKGTRTAYDAALASNHQLLKYRLLAKHMASPEEEVAKGSVQYYINRLWEDPNAALDGLSASKAAIAKGYRAYFLFVNDGAGKDVNTLMNSAIKEAFNGKKGANFPKFDPTATYSYEGIDQLLTHLRFLHEVSADSPSAPCWLFRKHPAAALKAFGPMGGSESNLKLQACGGFWEWEEVKLLDAIARDLCGQDQLSEAQCAKTHSEIAGFYLTPKAVGEDERKELEAWSASLWKGLDGWSSRDPMLLEISNALKISFFQTEALFEDYFMDEGFNEKEAKALGLAAMKSLVGHHLARFI